MIDNHAQYNITAVNLSLSDGNNYASNWFAQDGGVGQQITGLIDQLDALNIPVIAATGNSFNGQQGDGLPVDHPRHDQRDLDRRLRHPALEQRPAPGRRGRRRLGHRPRRPGRGARRARPGQRLRHGRRHQLRRRRGQRGRRPAPADLQAAVRPAPDGRPVDSWLKAGLRPGQRPGHRAHHRPPRHPQGRQLHPRPAGAGPASRGASPTTPRHARIADAGTRRLRRPPTPTAAPTGAHADSDAHAATTTAQRRLCQRRRTTPTPRRTRRRHRRISTPTTTRLLDASQTPITRSRHSRSTTTSGRWPAPRRGRQVVEQPGPSSVRRRLPASGATLATPRRSWASSAAERADQAARPERPTIRTAPSGTRGRSRPLAVCAQGTSPLESAERRRIDAVAASEYRAAPSPPLSSGDVRGSFASRGEVDWPRRLRRR